MEQEIIPRNHDNLAKIRDSSRLRSSSITSNQFQMINSHPDSLEDNSEGTDLSALVLKKRIERESTRKGTNLGAHPSELHSFIADKTQVERKGNDGPLVNEEKIEEILQKQHRSSQDAKRLLRYLLEKNQYFRNLAEGENGLAQEALTQLCMNLKYQEYKAGTPIIQEGEPSNGKFYVIFSGQVYVIVKKIDVITEANANNCDDSSTDSDSSTSLSEILNMDEPKEKKDPNPFLFAKKSLFNLHHKSQGTPTSGPTKNPLIKKMQAAGKLITLAGKLKTNIESSDSASDRSLLISPRMKRPSIQEDSVVMRRGSVKLDPLLWEKLKDSTVNGTSPNGSRSNSIVLTNNNTPRSRRASIMKKLIDFDNIIPNDSLDSISNIEDKPKKKFTPEEIQEKILKRADKFGKIKDTIISGFAFGEAALVSGEPRGATIFAAETTKLIVIDTNDYKLIRSKHEPEKRRVIEFMVDNIPDLDQIHAYKIIEDLSYLLEKRQFNFGSVIANEGEHGENIYLLLQGAIEISKTLVIEETKPHTNHHVRIKPNFKEDVKVSIVEVPGSFLGEELLFEKDKKYHFKSKVVSATATLYAINRKKFLYRFHHTTKVILQNVYESKKHERMESLKQKLAYNYKNMKIFGHEMEELAHKRNLDDFLLKHQIVLQSQGDHSINSKLKIRQLNSEAMNMKTTKEIETFLTLSDTSSLPKISNKHLNDDLRNGKKPVPINLQSVKYNSESASSIGESKELFKSSPRFEYLSTLREKRVNTLENQFFSISGRDFTPKYYQQKVVQKDGVFRSDSFLPDSLMTTTFSTPRALNSKEKTLSRSPKRSVDNKGPERFNMSEEDEGLKKRRKIKKFELAKRYGTLEDVKVEVHKTYNFQLLKNKVLRQKLSDKDSTISNLMTTRTTCNPLEQPKKLKSDSEDFDRLFLTNPSNIKQYVVKNKPKLMPLQTESNSPRVPLINLGKIPLSRSSSLTQEDILKQKSHHNLKLRSQLKSKTPRLSTDKSDYRDYRDVYELGKSEYFNKFEIAS